MTRILALPGSLRKDSSSNKVLRAFAGYLPADYTITIFDTGSLPHFNDASDVPNEVKHLHREISQCDAIVICTPEYAFGIPGTLKNALDWTVGTGDFLNKIVTLITASSSGQSGHTAMLLVLQAIAADISAEDALLISGIRAKMDRDGEVIDADTQRELKMLAEKLKGRIGAKKS